jgi:hypothetical protein
MAEYLELHHIQSKFISNSHTSRITQVGSSTVTWAWDGTLVWTDGLYDTSSLRGFRHTFHTGVPWVWTAAGAAASVSYLSLSVFLLLTLRIRRQNFF